MALFNMLGSIFQASEERTAHGSVYYTPKESLTRRGQRGKLNKSDIGSPTNFKHVTHVGFNAVPSFDANSEIDLKRILNMAGVKEEHLQDPEVSYRIFSVLEKAGAMEAVRKQTRRMTSVERPSPRTRFRSLSSSSLGPTKRQNCLEQDSPHAAKIAAVLARGSQLCYLPSLGKVPPPMETPPPLSPFPSRPPPPMPPYLEELCQSFSLADNLSVRHHSKKGSPPPQSLSAKKSMKMPPPLLRVAKSLPSETFGIPLAQPVPGHSCADSTTNMVSSSPLSIHHFNGSSEKINCIPAHFPSSIPCIEPTIKCGDVPSPPSLELFAKLNSETITPCHPKECLLNTDPISAAIPSPPPPPLLAFEKQSLENPLFNGSELPLICGNVDSSNEPEQQTNPAMYLDQIKQGVQLKSVTQTVKVENAECSNLVAALMDVLKRRHRAIHSSDEDVEEEDWED